MKTSHSDRPEGESFGRESESDAALGEALRERLGDARTTRSFSAAREARLVAKVLRQTTREDLSWRGELSLFGEFVRDRVSSSPALKLLAASLIVHLALGGPLLAYWAYHAAAERKQPMITFELPEDPFDGESADGEESEALTEVVEAGPDAETLLRDRVHNARRVGRFQLSRARLEVRTAKGMTAADASTVEIGLLRARSSLFAERRWSLPTPLLSGATPASSLAVCLSAELLLDRLILEDQRPAELTGVLEAVADLAASPSGDAAAPLAQRILTRARAYGAWSQAAEGSPSQAPAVIDGAWCALVSEALREAGISGIELELVD